MNPCLPAIGAGALAIVGFNAVYLISAFGGQVEHCIPYFHGCTSISRAGRQIPAIYAYRGTIVPSALLMLVYWWLAYRWLVEMGFGKSGMSKAIAGLGIVASASLVVFALCLGSSDESLRPVRRYGAALFFAGTGLAQILLTERILRASRRAAEPFPSCILIAKVVLCGGILFYCLANFVVSYYDNRALQNVIEWQVATAMAVYFMLTASVWRASRFLAR
jgi:hypothetical protein